MKNKILNYKATLTYTSLLLIAVIFYSCGTESNNQQNKVEAIRVDANWGVQILTVDSCEYVWRKNGYAAGLTHKGNCKYCVERSKK